MIRFFALMLYLVALPAFVLAGELIPTSIQTKTGTLTLMLEVAATPDAREIGLSKRNSMGGGDGMLFVFPSAGDYEFWMKDTKIPLDMLFLEPKKHKIAFIADNTVPFSLTPIGANQNVQAVIELDAGRAASDNIAVGDVVSYEIPKTIHVY